jgi:hypothetical protein
LNLKSEIAHLNKKLKEKENETIMKTKLFDNIIEEYKNKIQSLIVVNESAMNKIKELDLCKKNSNEIENSKLLVEKQLKNLKENFELEIKEKKKQEEKYKNLVVIIKNLIRKIQILYEEEEKFHNHDLNLFVNKLDEFFKPR